MTPDAALAVAIDVGPLHGHRTGVGRAVAALVDALGRRDDIALHPYLVSARAHVTPPERRLPIPAAVAVRSWARLGRPRADRWLRGCSLVHGTNYVVPPTRMAALASVYDCWSLRHPDRATPAVRRAGAALRHAVRAGAHVHVTSEATAAAARELLDTDRVHVVHLGALPAPTAASVAPVAGLAGVPFVLAVGTLERRKALPTLIRAHGSVARRTDGARLVLAGAPGDDEAGVRAAIAELPGDVASRVLVLGPVDEATKGWLLAHAAALAVPSLDEGFGFPLLEAQAAGLPVVARRAGSTPEIGGDGVLLVDDADGDAFVEPLADALVRVLGDGALRLGLIAAGHANLSRFDWDETAARLAACYRDMVAEHGARL
jgi:glycosyltransferase involved in cell wall biosynthesis